MAHHIKRDLETLYMFEDEAGAEQVVSEAFAGRHGAIIEAALSEWQTFAQAVAESGSVVLLDGCLLGYLQETDKRGRVSTPVHLFFPYCGEPPPRRSRRYRR